MAAGLAVIVLAPIFTGLPSIPVKVIDAVYLTVSDRWGQHDLANFVRHREFWQREPNIYGASLDAALNPGGGQVAATDGSGDLSYFSIQDLASNAPSYAGYPVEFVGRVASVTTISTDIESYDAVEYELTGSSPGSVAYLTTAEDNTPNFGWSIGQIVVVRGVVVASGLSRQLDNSLTNAVYVYGFDSDDASNHPSLDAIVRSIGRSR